MLPCSIDRVNPFAQELALPRDGRTDVTDERSPPS
jgi:hypothetical protein